MNANFDVKDNGCRGKIFNIGRNESHPKSLWRLYKRREVRGLPTEQQGGLIKQNPRWQGCIVRGNSIVTEV